jgi:hypothetical protein
MSAPTKVLKLQSLPWPKPHRHITQSQWDAIGTITVYAEREPAAMWTPCGVRWVWRVPDHESERVRGILGKPCSVAEYTVCSHLVRVR